jgi:predicted glutamine amidotransferase
MQFDSFEKVFFRIFQQICCNVYHFKYTRGRRGQHPKLWGIFYFESDIPKMFTSDIPVVEIK